MANLFGRVGAALCLSLTLAAQAQTAPQDWQHVQQLPTNAKIRVVADSRKTICRLTAVTADRLTCASSKGQTAFTRAEIKSIKLANRGRSIAVGAAIGLGVGAGAGAGIGAAINTGDSGSLAHVSGGKATGVGAGVGTAILGITGAFIGMANDTLAASTIYKR